MARIRRLVVRRFRDSDPENGQEMSFVIPAGVLVPGDEAELVGITDDYDDPEAFVEVLDRTPEAC